MMFTEMGFSGFKYLGCILEESGIDGAEYNRKVASGRRVAVNARDLQLQCTRVLHQTLLVHVLIYGSEIMLRREKKRSRIRTVEMENLRGLLGIDRMDRVPNARIREFFGVKKGVDERIYEGVLCRRGWRGIGSPRGSM